MIGGRTKHLDGFLKSVLPELVQSRRLVWGRGFQRIVASRQMGEGGKGAGSGLDADVQGVQIPLGVQRDGGR